MTCKRLISMDSSHRLSEIGLFLPEEDSSFWLSWKLSLLTFRLRSGWSLSSIAILRCAGGSIKKVHSNDCPRNHKLTGIQFFLLTCCTGWLALWSSLSYAIMSSIFYEQNAPGVLMNPACMRSISSWTSAQSEGNTGVNILLCWIYRGIAFSCITGCFEAGSMDLLAFFIPTHQSFIVAGEFMRISGNKRSFLDRKRQNQLKGN